MFDEPLTCRERTLGEIRDATKKVRTNANEIGIRAIRYVASRVSRIGRVYDGECDHVARDYGRKAR